MSIFEDDYVDAEQEEKKVNKKKTLGETIDENLDKIICIAAGGTLLGMILKGKRKRKIAADHEAEKQLIGQIAYQAGQKDAYRDVATRRRRNKHKNNHVN